MEGAVDTMSFLEAMSDHLPPPPPQRQVRREARHGRLGPAGLLAPQELEGLVLGLRFPLPPAPRDVVLLDDEARDLQRLGHGRFDVAST